MSSVLENEIGLLEAEISKLNTKVTSLQDEKRNLEAQVREERSKNSQITKIQNENRNLIDLLKERDQKMESLENEIISLKKENKTIKREVEKKYENEIGYYKNLNETNTTKVDNANIILKLNERQHEAILKLEDKIDEIKRADAEYQKQMQIKHENQFTNLKRKMMDHIKNAQKNMAQSNLDNLDLNTKISKLTTNQLLIELEEQSYQIEDLLKEREKNKKEIFALKTELNTHKKVEHILQEKNKRYLDMVKACDKKIEKSKKNNTNNNNSDDYDLIINDDNENMTNNNNFQNFKKFEKMYTKLFKDYQNLKGVYESLRDRERSQQQKFEGIINLYKMVIDDLVNDEEFRNKKDIYVNIEEIKKGNFEKFSKEEKYSILVYLMKHLLPLVNSENNEINSFKEKIDSVEINGNNKFMSKTTYGDFYGVKNRNLFNKNENRLNTIGNFEKRAISSIHDKTNKNRTFTKFPKIETLFAENNIKQKHKDSKILFRFLNIPNN
jgi:hypothetical protein